MSVSWGTTTRAATGPLPAERPRTEFWPVVGRAVRLAARVAVSAILVVIFLGPFYWMILTAFQSLSEAASVPPTFWVDSLRFDNFAEAFRRADFLHYAANSAIITGGTIVGQFIVVVPAAYAFARFEFRGKKVLFGIVLATMMIPGQLIFLPVFVMYAGAGMLNTHLSLILPFLASGFALFMLRQSFMQVPDALIEAARLDNASEFTIVWRIMLPLARPVIVTVALLTFIGTWNNYFFPLVWTTTDAVRTLPLAVQQLKSVDEIAPNITMAGNMLLVIPILVVFAFARRHIMQAFAYTGVK